MSEIKICITKVFNLVCLLIFASWVSCYLLLIVFPSVCIVLCSWTNLLRFHRCIVNILLLFVTFCTSNVVSHVAMRFSINIISRSNINCLIILSTIIMFFRCKGINRVPFRLRFLYAITLSKCQLDYCNTLLIILIILLL